MQNLKRKIDKIKAKLLTNQQFLSNFDKNNRLEPKKRLFLKANKRYLRADVLSLLSSALRPRLLGRAGNPINYTAFSGFFIHNRGEKASNVVKIVVMTTILGVFGLFSMNVATPVSAASLTLSVPNDTLKLDLQPNNTFSKSSASSVSVKTDALGGYTLSIKAKNSNELVNGGNKISSITGNLTEDQYKVSGNTNTWGYQPSKFSSSNNTAFLPGPTTSPSTIEKTNAKNDTANNYNFVIGAKVDSALPNGSYSNTFVFTATANTVSYSITYNLNDGTWNGKSPQTGNTIENTVKLDTSMPTRDNYEFKGWCPQETHNANCGTASYQPGVDFPLNDNSGHIILWAMWEQAAPTTMQEFGDYCQSMTIHQALVLEDVRDSNNYTIIKTKDTKCWMTQNLRIGSNNNTMLLSPDNTDISQSYTLPQGNAEGFKTEASIYIDQEYGGYYSYNAATANSGKNAVGIGQEAIESICPKGWRLPTLTDYSKLASQYGYNHNGQMLEEPLNFQLGKEYNWGKLSQYEGGYYRVSTSMGIIMSNPDFGPTFVTDGISFSNSDSYNGRSVRCIATSGEQIMQNVAEWSGKIEEGETITVIDSRDQRPYTVAKLKDGKIWMTENLKIGSYESSLSLLSNTSDTLQSFSLPMIEEQTPSNNDDTKAYIDYNISFTKNNGMYNNRNYSWVSATAGTANSIKDDNQNAEASICPKGWHLPTQSEFINLLKYYEDNSNGQLLELPAGFDYVGSDSSGFGSQNGNQYWSSTSSGNSSAYALSVKSSGADADTSYPRRSLFKIRCVARENE